MRDRREDFEKLNPGRKYLLREMFLTLPVTKRTCYRMLNRGFTTLDMLELKRQAAGEKILRVSDICKIFGVHRSNVYRWFHDGLLQGFKLGKSIFIFKSSLMEFVEIFSDEGHENFREYIEVTVDELCENRLSKKKAQLLKRPKSFPNLDLRTMKIESLKNGS